MQALDQGVVEGLDEVEDKSVRVRDGEHAKYNEKLRVRLSE